MIRAALLLTLLAGLAQASPQTDAVFEDLSASCVPQLESHGAARVDGLRLATDAEHLAPSAMLGAAHGKVFWINAQASSVLIDIGDPRVCPILASNFQQPDFVAVFEHWRLGQPDFRSAPGEALTTTGKAGLFLARRMDNGDAMQLTIEVLPQPALPVLTLYRVPDSLTLYRVPDSLAARQLLGDRP